MHNTNVIINLLCGHTFDVQTIVKKLHQSQFNNYSKICLLSSWLYYSIIYLWIGSYTFRKTFWNASILEMDLKSFHTVTTYVHLAFLNCSFHLEAPGIKYWRESPKSSEKWIYLPWVQGDWKKSKNTKGWTILYVW